MVVALDTSLRAPPVRQFLGAASVELPARDQAGVERLQDWFAAGTEVFINFVPGMDFRRTVETASALRRAAFLAVPHLAARNFTGVGELDEALAQLTGEAGVTKVLCIAGDLAVPRGPFGSALGMIQSGALQRHGITTVGIAGYPEGHHTLTSEALHEALAAKLWALGQAHLQSFIVTQFCFESAPILDWLRDLRRSEIHVPVRVGVAGPASIRTLLTFAMRCGVGNSLRVLLNQPQSIGRLLRDVPPDALVCELAEGLGAAAQSGSASLHLFPFGGVAKAGEWRRRVLG